MPNTRPVSQSLQEYARGVGGGLLFSLPLFYTMEVWQIGLTAEPERLIAFVVGTFGLLVAYNHFAGIRDEHTIREDLLESVEELGIGLALAAGLLFLLGRFPPEALSLDTLGLLTVQGMIAAVGVSVGTAQLGQTPDSDESDDEESKDGEDTDRTSDAESEDGSTGDDADQEDAGSQSGPRTAGGELTVAMCGAMLIASNVAPTEEVLMIGSEMGLGHLAGLIALSLIVGGGLLYFSEFRGSRRLDTLSLGPLRGTLLTYAVALVASAVLLWTFGHAETAGLYGSLGPLVVLGFPAMLGASAGRLLLLGSSF